MAGAGRVLPRVPGLHDCGRQGALPQEDARCAPQQCSDLTPVSIGMHRNAPLSPMEEGARVHHSYGSYAPSTYGSYEPRRANPSTAPRVGPNRASRPMAHGCGVLAENPYRGTEPSPRFRPTLCNLCYPRVRRMPSWPGSWANFSLLSLSFHRNAWANLHRLGHSRAGHTHHTE
jgi:hypothetical protein